MLLRRLRIRLRGKPRLIVPSVVITTARRWVIVNEAKDDEFLWGPEVSPDPMNRRGVRLPAPSDAEWAEQYNAIKDGHVTYDAVTAQARLTDLIHIGATKPTLVDRVQRHQTATKGST